MSAPWNYVQMDVVVDWDDVERARQSVIDAGGDVFCHLTVPGEVDLDEALEEATVEQLRDALGREVPGYTQEQLDAIHECFGELAHGNIVAALALLPRVFEHEAEIRAAEAGVRHFCRARAA